MSLSFISWEWITVSTVFVVIFTAFIPGRIKYFASLLTLVPLLVEFLITRKGDLFFHLELFSTSTLVSWMNTILIAEFVRSKWKRLALLTFSLFISLAMWLITPSLVFFDFFWGIIPGPVTLDPVILTDAYWTRLVLSGVAWFITAIFRSFKISYAWMILSPWVMGFFILTPASLPYLWEKRFQEKASRGLVEVYLESERASDFSAAFWAEELSFWLQELKKRLPADAQMDSNEKYRVYVYDNHLSKSRWTGARRIQIGNFFQKRMHLSRMQPYEHLVQHELTHLIHGNLKVPLKSYTNPTVFEGFAEALSTPNIHELIRKGAALAQVVKPPRSSVDFYTQLPQTASYTISGALAALFIDAKTWPWELSLQDFERLRTIQVSDAELEEAKKILEEKPVLKQPRLRDCARMKWNLEQSRLLNDWNLVLHYCENDETLSHYIFKLDKDYRLEALNKWMGLPKISQGDRATLKNERLKALGFYKEANATLQARMSEHEMSFDKWREIVSKSRQPYVDLLELYPDEPSAQKELLDLLPAHETSPQYKNLTIFSQLTSRQKTNWWWAKFYESQTRTFKRRFSQDVVDIRDEILNSTDDPILKARLLWQIENEQHPPP